MTAIFNRARVFVARVDRVEQRANDFLLEQFLPVVAVWFALLIAFNRLSPRDFESLTFLVLALAFALKSWLIRRIGVFGWSMSLFNASMSAIYLYTFLLRYYPDLGDEQIKTGVRVIAISCSALAIVQLCKASFRRRRKEKRHVAWTNYVANRRAHRTNARAESHVARARRFAGRSIGVAHRTGQNRGRKRDKAVR